MKKMFQLGVLLASAMTLAACGGGGGGSGGGDDTTDNNNNNNSDTPVYSITCDAGSGTDIVGCWTESCRVLHDDAVNTEDTFGYAVHSFHQDGTYDAMLRVYDDASCSTHVIDLDIVLPGYTYVVTGDTFMTDQGTLANEVNMSYGGLTYYTSLDLSTSFLCFPNSDLLLDADQLLGWVPTNNDENDRPTSIPDVLTLGQHCLVRASY